MTEATDRVLASQLQGVARRLGTEFAGVFSTETIDGYLEQSANRFVDAPARDFIPIMAERVSPANASGHSRRSMGSS